MSNANEVREEIITIASIVAGYPSSEIRVDDDIRDELSIDSLKLMEIIARIESKYEIELDESELVMLNTINELAELVINVIEVSRQTDG